MIGADRHGGGSGPLRTPRRDGRPYDAAMTVTRSEDEWRQRLSPAQYHVLREGGTEPAFSGEYVDCHDPGVYRCAACGTPLFSSEDKFDSGTGWPSFTRPLSDEALFLLEDRSHGMVRTEVRCRGCGSHLGHVFPDGPPPTGLRYCMNSLGLSLDRAGRAGGRGGES
jgi:peptide-methionine (R)-S-oxide reductase